MGHIRIVEHYDAPIEQVYELAADAMRIPEWNTTTVEVTNVSGPMDHVGASFDARMKFLGRAFRLHFEVLTVEPPRLLKSLGKSIDGDREELLARLTPVATGTDAEIELTYEFHPSILTELADRLFIERAVERELRHSVENFKALVEARVPMPV